MTSKLKTSVFVVFLFSVIVGVIFFLNKLSKKETKIPTQIKVTQMKTQQTQPPQELPFTYEAYDHVFGSAGVNGIIYVAVASGVDDLTGTFTQLKPFIDKGVFKLSVRNLGDGFINTKLSEDQKPSSEMVIGFTNCVKIFAPKDYYLYISNLMTSYNSKSEKPMKDAVEVANWLMGNLPSGIDRAQEKKCVVDKSYTIEAEKEANFINKFGIGGTPTILFPETKQSIVGFIKNQTEATERLGKYFDLGSYGFTNPSSDQTIKKILK